MIHYFVNKKRRTVIAVLGNTANDEMNSIYRKSGGVYIPWEVEEAAKMPRSFRVEVVCAPEDEFSEEVGKKIAKKRVLDNYDRSRKKAHKRAEEAWKAYSKRIEGGLK